MGSQPDQGAGVRRAVWLDRIGFVGLVVGSAFSAGCIMIAADAILGPWL